MKHLLLAPFLLGFISPVFAEVDEKEWLNSPGSTSEWLEVKNWDNDYWWRLYLPFYKELIEKFRNLNPYAVHQVFTKKRIDVERIQSCWNFLELHDMPKEVEQSCLSLHKQYFLEDPDFKKSFFKEGGFPTAYHAFAKGEKWEHLDTKLTLEIKNAKSRVSGDEALKNINFISALDRGFFNDEYMNQVFNYPNKKKISASEKRGQLCNTASKLALRENWGVQKAFKNIGFFAYCLEITMEDEKYREWWKERKQKVYDMGKCIEAKDLVGCLKHNKMDWLAK